MGGVNAKQPDDEDMYPDSKLDTVTDTTGDAWKSLCEQLPSGTLILWFLLALIFLSILMDLAGA